MTVSEVLRTSKLIPVLSCRSRSQSDVTERLVLHIPDSVSRLFDGWSWRGGDVSGTEKKAGSAALWETVKGSRPCITAAALVVACVPLALRPHWTPSPAPG